MVQESDYIDKRGEQGLFEPIIPDIRSWPIFRLGLIREKLIEAVVEESRKRILSEMKSVNDLRDLIAETYYHERVRMKEAPWKVDPPDEKTFWKAIKSGIQQHAALNPDLEEAWDGYKNLLDTILYRYAEEIAGNFKLNTFHLAKRLIDLGFARLLSSATDGIIRGNIRPKKRLLEKIQFRGDLERIRELSGKGIVLMLPTHFSNLDSIVVGWAISALGLPAFTYGAGINLFGHPILSYFMSRLGAYRVDRRKKNEIYLTLLKVYSQEVIERGCHSLFFPGGTRSRSGGIEDRLKLGLLGSALEAQRNLIKQDGTDYRRIYVVPLVVSYHVVLEAPNLIEEHLKGVGKEKSILLQDDFGSIWKNLKFLWKFFKSGSEIYLSYGKPMDLFGNELDENGHSVAPNGKSIDIADYFMSNDKLVRDNQRDSEYTRKLGGVILDRYYKENCVFSSHLVAFTAFQCFRKSNKIDLYELLAISPDEFSISYPDFLEAVQTNLDKLRDMAAKGNVKLADHLNQSTAKIISHGLGNLGVYHAESPLKQEKSGDIITQNLKVLYFYHNRLHGYGL